jgi:tetratricopeptide (TPR) repeat protein
MINFFKANKKVLAASLIIFAAVFLLYAKTINYKLTDLDDVNFIHTAASQYEKTGSFFAAFKHNVLFETAPTPYYRPILAQSFIIDNKIAGQSDSFPHFTNILLHAIASLLVFFFLRRYVFGNLTAFLSALLFAVHPIVIYTAAWIPGRNDSIFFAAFMLAFIFFIQYLRNSRAIFLLCHFFFILVCYFTKESGIILPFVFALYFFTNKDKEMKLNIRVYILWIISLFIFFTVKKLVFGFEGGGLPVSLNLSQDNIGMSFDYYASILFLRTPFAANFSLKIIFMGIFSFLFFAFLAFYKRNISQIRKNVFYFLFPLCFILPTLASERLWFQGNRLYEPLFGFIVIFFSFLSPYIENRDAAKEKLRKIVIGGVCVLIGFSAFISFKSMDYFNGSIPFWNKIIVDSLRPNITAYKFYAYALINNKRPREAVNTLLPVCQALNFSYDETNYALGQAFLLSGDFENAAKLYEFMIANNQLLIPQTYASAIIAYTYLNDQRKASYWMEEFSKKFNVPAQTTIEYINNFNAYLRNIAAG